MNPSCLLFQLVDVWRAVCTGRSVVTSVAIILSTAAPVWAQHSNALSADAQTSIAAAVRQVLARTGTPSAQVGIIEHGKVVYTEAFGDARLVPQTPATPAMQYGVGSISKQFTAAAAMLLVEQGKLRLDAPVSTWFPELAHASEITLRNLLNQVSGYSDFYTEDYLTPELAASTTPYSMVKRWTSRPLDFAPGTQWQYSSTNYQLAALIIEKVAGQPFFDFLEANILRPAGLKHVIDLEGEHVPALPQGYVHFAFGPARETAKEGRGTVFGAGQLAMPIGDLMQWDTVVMERKILKPASWQTMQAEVDLPDGTGSGYGMGFFLEAQNARRVIEHSGGLNGFTSLNQIYPTEDAAIGVLTNAETGTGDLVRAIEAVLFAPVAEAEVRHDEKSEALLKTVLEGLEKGRLDRSLLAPNLSFFFTELAIEDYQASLADLGEITSIEPRRSTKRGGMSGLSYTVHGASGPPIRAFIYVTNDGKLDQLLLRKAP